MRQVIAFSLVLVATPAVAAHCPHGELWRVRLGKCVSLSSREAVAYVQPQSHRQRINIVLPAQAEPPIAPAEIHLQDVDPNITDIPLTDPDPATMVLKQQLERTGQ
jgi:hypothetical protein